MISEVHTISQTMEGKSISMADFKQKENKHISFSERVQTIFKEIKDRSQQQKAQNTKELKEDTQAEEKYSVFPFRQEKADESGKKDEKTSPEKNNITLTKKEWNIDKKNKSKERVILENILNLKEIVADNSSKTEKSSNNKDTAATGKSDKDNKAEKSSAQQNDITVKNKKSSAQQNNSSQKSEKNELNAKISVEGNEDRSGKTEKNDNKPDKVLNTENKTAKETNPEKKPGKEAANSSLNQESKAASLIEDKTDTNKIQNTENINDKKKVSTSNGINKVNIKEQKEKVIFTVKEDPKAETQNKEYSAKEISKKNETNKDDDQLINNIKKNMKKDNEKEMRINVKSDAKAEEASTRQSKKTKISELIKLLGNEKASSDIETISINAKKAQKVKDIEQKQAAAKENQNPAQPKQDLFGKFISGDKPEMKNKDQNMESQLKSLHNLINGSGGQNAETSGKSAVSNTESSPQFPDLRTIKMNEFGKTTLNTIKSMPDNSIHSARLVLQPKSLGTVMIEISLAGNIAKMDIKVDSREAAKSIESQLSNLKDKLANEGIKMESVNLKLSNQNREMKNNGDNNNPFSRKEEEEVKRDYINSFGFLKNTPETDETEKYESVRSFIEHGSSFGRYLH